jgi:hypothetical protein
MTGSDDEFDDFLKRRKPVFRATDDMFEPPAELDRVILRQARDAIEPAAPLRVFRGPRWAAPIALAATLVLAVGIVFQAGMPEKRKGTPAVTVENVAQRFDMAETTAVVPPAPATSTNQSVGAEADSSPVVVDLAQPKLARRERAPQPAAAGTSLSRDEAERYAASPPPVAAIEDSAAERAAGAGSMRAAAANAPAVVATAPAAKAAGNPAWRSDSKAWLAEIARLRNAGDTARADAELEEYKRQHRAYAVSPDQ